MKIQRQNLRAQIRKLLKEVTASDTAIELSEELSGINDTLKEVRDFCERGNMDFSVDGQTRVAALVEQAVDAIEEALEVLDEEEEV